MKKVIFVLTYNEGQEWVDNYPIEKYSEYFDDPDYKIIFLDNGNQAIIKDWAEKTNSIYFASENNIGTTGGYNWFMRVGELLESPRIAIMQADVQIFDPICFKYLFEKPNGTPWSYDEFIYWPNNLRQCWREDNLDPDCGQFFSLNPRFFIDNDYLCDENFTVTHFESTDLFLRMTNKQNYHPAKPFNLLTLFPDIDVHRHWLDDDIKNSLYKINSYTNQQGLHNKWFEYNWGYFKKKWAKDINLKSKDALNLFLKGRSMWVTLPWLDNENKTKYFQQLFIHRKGLITKRNTDVGQLPYPVEYEVNRFYIENIKSKKIDISEYSE